MIECRRGTRQRPGQSRRVERPEHSIFNQSVTAGQAVGQDLQVIDNTPPEPGSRERRQKIQSAEQIGQGFNDALNCHAIRCAPFLR